MSRFSSFSHVNRYLSKYSYARRTPPSLVIGVVIADAIWFNSFNYKKLSSLAW